MSTDSGHWTSDIGRRLSLSEVPMADGVLASDARRSLVERYLKGEAGHRPSEPPIVARGTRDPVPLSPSQEQIWVHAPMAPDLPLYNEPVAIHHTGPLDAGALERSLNEILRRHEILRTSIVLIDGEPRQVAHPAVALSLPVDSVRHLEPSLREAEARRLAREDARRPFALDQPPLLRARLVELGGSHQRLYLVISHLVFDGVNIQRVFLPELIALYDACVAGRPSPLPDPTIQFADFVCWQAQRGELDDLAPHLTYWRRQLAGRHQALTLPVDRPRAATQTYRGAQHEMEVEDGLAARVRTASRQAGVTLFQWLLATYAVLLHRYAGQDELVIGTISSVSRPSQTRALLGCFINMIPLRLELGGDPTFDELLTRVRQVVLDAMAHAAVPFGRLVKELGVARDPGRHPLFQTVFSVETPPRSPDPAWDALPWEVETGVTKYDLLIQVEDRSPRLTARFHYSADLFDEAMIARLAEHWQTLMAAAATEPATPVSRLPLLTPRDRHDLVTEWNQTAHPIPATTIHELFEARAARSPRAVAVECEDRRLTYGELNARADRMAEALVARGAGPDVLIGLCLDRSVDMVVALLAVLKAGAAYLPLVPSLPRDRLAFMIEDARPLLIVAEPSVRDLLPGDVPVLIVSGGAGGERAQESHPVRRHPVRPDHLAYVLYTSGSTGLPKGVAIEHHSVVNLLLAVQEELEFTATDRLLAVTTLAFDIAGVEILLPLISGGRLIVASSPVTQDGARLEALLSRSRPTVMDGTPATWRLLIEGGWAGSPQLNVICTGEALSPALARQLVQRSRAVWNLYGPTETTIWSTGRRVTRVDDRRLSIGRPIWNTQIYLLDAHKTPVPVGVAGEIYIGGEGLARGYLNRPELTAERFVPDPFSTRPGARLYRTGDRACYRADGSIELLGRTDHQVKLRGFRIELGEIEMTLARHPAVASAIVVLRQDGDREPMLVAYVVARDGRPIETEELRAFLSATLPDYMIPGRFVSLDAIPLTPSGKIDRAALPAPEAALDAAAAIRLVPPRDLVEARLVDLWERVLNVRPIGVRDDFFALGGHSLAAVRLFRLIEQGFGRRLPLSALLDAPTIERLAARVRGDAAPRHQWASLVPLQIGGSRPPLFCVHGHSGEVLFYRPLARRLGPDQPFFALQSSGQDGSPRHRTIEAMAAHYVAEMRSVQAHGPYRLAGYCYGTLVAFEMARQLIAAGEPVATLIFLSGFDAAPLGLRGRLHRHLEHVREIGPKRKLAHAAQTFETRVRARIVPAIDRVFADRLLRTAWLAPRIPELNQIAGRAYVPPFYPGRFTVLLSGPVPPGFALDPEVGVLGMRAGEMRLRLVPGERDTMMLEPHVEAVAREVQALLAEADEQRASQAISSAVI